MNHFAIVDDDDLSANLLNEHIIKYMNANNLLFKVTRFKEAVSFLSPYTANYDIVFMDIKMPLMDGMEASQKLRELDKQVVLIFVTDMANYALQGYSVSAYDFIVKDGTYENFNFKMARALAQCERIKDKKIVISLKNNVEVFAQNDLIYVDIENHKITFHLTDRNFSKYGSLNQVMEQLDEKVFRKCSCSHIVNLKYVTTFTEESEIILNDGEVVIPLSRAMKKGFYDALTEYLGGTFNV